MREKRTQPQAYACIPNEHNATYAPPPSLTLHRFQSQLPRAMLRASPFNCIASPSLAFLSHPLPPRRKHSQTSPSSTSLTPFASVMPFRLLNSRRTLRDSPVPDTADDNISATLKKKIQMLYVSYITASGIDYEGMRNSPEFASYVAETARLPLLNLHQALPDDAHKTAFFVNLYNACTQHAVIALGPPPQSGLARMFFGMNVGYRVGGYKLSLNDMEHGILRGNKGISVFPRPFSRRDKRRAFMVSEPDPRIHFVLNCAATSCPPVLFLTPENLERTLQLGTTGFLSNPDNFKVESGKVLLSRIFDWYRNDFECVGGVLEFIRANASGEQKDMLEELMGESKDIGIEYMGYNWSLNESK